MTCCCWLPILYCVDIVCLVLQMENGMEALHVTWCFWIYDPLFLQKFIDLFLIRYLYQNRQHSEAFVFTHCIGLIPTSNPLIALVIVVLFLFPGINSRSTCTWIIKTEVGGISGRSYKILLYVFPYSTSQPQNFLFTIHKSTVLQGGGGMRYFVKWLHFDPRFPSIHKYCITRMHVYANVKEFV